jgi:hypothetical protein
MLALVASMLALVFTLAYMALLLVVSAASRLFLRWIDRKRASYHGLFARSSEERATASMLLANKTPQSEPEHPPGL